MSNLKMLNKLSGCLKRGMQINYTWVTVKGR